MMFSPEIIRLIDAFDSDLQKVFLAILAEIERQREANEVHGDIVELKGLVRNLVLAQERTEQRIEALGQSQQSLVQAQERTEQQLKELAQSQQALTQAQEHTEQRVGALIQAQERTEQRVGALIQAQERTEQRIEALTQVQERGEQALLEMRQSIAVLARSSDATRSKVEGLSRSVAYALENDAYRYLPAYLAQRGIEVEKHFIRTTINGEEINLLAHAKRGSEAVIVVGESVLRLDDRQKFEQLARHVELAAAHYGLPAVPVMITHYAKPHLLALAEQEGVIVAQSFEWAGAVTAVQE
mgnify:CR=1 FL=1